MPAWRRGFIDFYFNFFLTNGAVGGLYRTGQNANFGWQAENITSQTDYVVGNDEVLEIEGLEIFGPMDDQGAGYLTGTRVPLKSVKLVIGGQVKNNVIFNELNAPAISPMFNDCGYPFNDGNSGSCINFGRGLLAPGGINQGTPTWTCTPKVGSGQKLAVEVNIPPAAEMGITHNAPVNNMRVRVHYCKVKGEAKLLEVLERNGFLAKGGQVNQSFEVGDAEMSEVLPLQAINKMVPDSGAFKMDDWTSLLGGNEVDKPYVENLIAYSKNNAATTINEWYEFTQEGLHVVNSDQVLKWNPGKYEAYKLEYAAVKSYMNLRYLRFFQGGRSLDTVLRVDPDINRFMFPLTPWSVDDAREGPGKLGRGIWGQNEQLSVMIKDNGTSIPAWATTVDAAMVGVWGKYFRLKGA